MAERFLVRIDPAAGSCAWIGTADFSRTGEGRMEEAAAAAGGAPVRLLLPGTEVLLTWVQLPVRNRSRARAAIPWALEDRLASEVEDLHFALGRSVGDQWPVAIIGRAFLADVLERGRTAGLNIDSAVAEPLALPAPEEGHWSVLEEPQRTIVRTGAVTGFACEPELLAAVAATETPPDAIDSWRGPGASAHTWPDAFASVAIEEQSARSALAVFAASPAAPPIDLLQGPFSRTDQRWKALRRWRLPAALAAALLVLFGLQGAVSFQQREARVAELRDRLQTVYNEAFPGAGTTRDPRGQMESRLRALRGSGREDSRFAETVQQAGAVLREYDEVELRELTWRSGTLDLAIRGQQLTDLDAVQRGLEERGMSAELSDVNRGEDRVSGRLRVQGEAS